MGGGGSATSLFFNQLGLGTETQTARRPHPDPTEVSQTVPSVQIGRLRPEREGLPKELCWSGLSTHIPYWRLQPAGPCPCTPIIWPAPGQLSYLYPQPLDTPYKQGTCHTQTWGQAALWPGLVPGPMGTEQLSGNHSSPPHPPFHVPLFWLPAVSRHLKVLKGKCQK